MTTDGRRECHERAWDATIRLGPRLDPSAPAHTDRACSRSYQRARGIQSAGGGLAWPHCSARDDEKWRETASWIVDCGLRIDASEVGRVGLRVGSRAGWRLPAAVWIDEGENVIDLVGYHNLRHQMHALARVVELRGRGRGVTRGRVIFLRENRISEE